MSFHFSLESVLRIRGITEEQEERLLQNILFEAAQAREALARTEEEIVALDAARSANLFKPSAGHYLHASYGEAKQLKQRREDLKDRLESLDQLRCMQIAAYEAARRNREMLTGMRDEKFGLYESEMARGEQKMLDENYIARRGRR